MIQEMQREMMMGLAFLMAPEMMSLSFTQELDNVVDIMNHIEHSQLNEDVDNEDDDGEAQFKDDDHVI